MDKANKAVMRERIQNRLTQLRMEKDVSARKMSLDLHLSESYMAQVERGIMLPSMDVFLSICEYFDVTPLQFFNEGNGGKAPSKAVMDACDMLAEMPERWQCHVIGIINSLMG